MIVSLLVNYYVFVIVSLSVAILGFCSGILGTFAYLRRASLFADTISHAALPGIALMFLFTHTRNVLLLLSGGALSAFVAGLCIMVLAYVTVLAHETILGIVLSVFFGLGLVFLSIVQKIPTSHQSILNKFLFGQTATLMLHDLSTIFCLSCFALFMVMVCWKPFVMITFDRSFSQSVGCSLLLFDGILLGLWILIIMIGLQTVGVVLMSSFFIAPAVAAFQWTQKISAMAFIAGVCAAGAAVLGAMISLLMSHVPPGPVIVVILNAFAGISILINVVRSYQVTL